RHADLGAVDRHSGPRNAYAAHRPRLDAQGRRHIRCAVEPRRAGVVRAGGGDAGGAAVPDDAGLTLPRVFSFPHPLGKVRPARVKGWKAVSGTTSLDIAHYMVQSGFQKTK